MADNVLETALRRERAPVLAGLIGAIALSWLYLVPAARDMYGAMVGPARWMMRADWDAPYTLGIFLMWSVMMVGMMLPSAAPAILLYARALRGAQDAVARSYAFAGGYLVAWTAFSAAATALQFLFARSLLLTPMMAARAPEFSAAVLALAGLYQWTPLKAACLSQCRAPVDFLTRHWRPGLAGAFGTGVRHGLYCLGCCWALMLLLFAGGVMNLACIAAIAIFVLVEKLAPQGAQAGRIGGALLLVAALALLR